MSERVPSGDDVRRVLVVGLAETGAAVARVFRSDGVDVTIVEDAPAATEQYRGRVAEMAAAGAAVIERPEPTLVAELVRASDLVVPSPLVRPSHVAIDAARAADVPVRSEIDVAAERATVPIVAITGTNGKTTVTSMTSAMLLASGVRAIAAGNIGRPLIEAVADDVDVVVAEVSSFQLEFVGRAFRPRVAVLLAVTPDHLDWHGSFDRYAAAKARITAFQSSEDLLVFDADDPRAAAIASQSPARRVGVSARDEASGCYRVVGQELVYPDGAPIAPDSVLTRRLVFDRTNALSAAAAALEVGAELSGVLAALRDYATMPHRVALVGKAGGVEWYDDSKATNPDATRRAISSFDSVVLLAGGRNKGLDLGVLADESDRLRGVVAFGEAGDEVAAAFAGTVTPVQRVENMHDAVRVARDLARPGDVVLLSPACASFDAYPGYGARGDDFAREVRAQVLEGASR
jgi:UDP-N-acetylmuramoylalanine--D-glutamate ligase